MTYTGFNIGPIMATLDMARRPRELWSASYIFSFLMECILDSIPENCRIISPTHNILNTKESVGLYPDRAFIEGRMDVSAVEKSAIEKFLSGTGLDSFNYFNLMSTCCEADSCSSAIADLNAAMDMMELCNTSKCESDRNSVLELIQKKYNSPLFIRALGDRRFPVDSLGEIAASVHKANKERWPKFQSTLNEESTDEDPYNKVFGRNGYKSFEKYICAVRADGDNMGRLFSSPELNDDQINKLSEKLIEFGINASKEIREFGGMPVYAGGDDLLFIAPVVGRDKDGQNMTVFDLIERIDGKCFKSVIESTESLNLRNPVAKPSMSYGIAVTYYKFPLYEALEMAGNLLFGRAKKLEGKNAIAWRILKHSGSDFEAAFSRNVPDFNAGFSNLVASTKDGSTVSAVAHKIREFHQIVEIVLESKDSSRLDSLFKNVFECNDSDYYKAVKNIMPAIYEHGETDKFGETIYDLLRTAKFIKGEDPNDD